MPLVSSVCDLPTRGPPVSAKHSHATDPGREMPGSQANLRLLRQGEVVQPVKPRWESPVKKLNSIGIQFARLVCRELRPVRVEDGVLVVEWLRLSPQHTALVLISPKTGGQTWSVLINRLPCQALELSCKTFFLMLHSAYPHSTFFLTPFSTIYRVSQQLQL